MNNFKILVTTILFVFTSILSFAGKKVTINTDEGGKIFVDGKLIGTNTVKISVESNSSVNVRVEKVGFITAERNYVNNKSNKLPSTDYIRLEVDDAFENSFTTDLANRDIDVKTSLPELDAWKLLSRIVQGYFDVIEVSDNTTGYLRTAWVVKNFKAATIRTRLIVKAGSTTPLSYKVKLVSEIAPADASSRADEAFKMWDRVLRSFENVVPEIQSRMSK